MIRPVHSGGALNAACNVLRKSTANLDKVAQKVDSGGPDANSLVSLKRTEQDIKIQITNLRTTLQQQEYIIDILA